MHDMKEFNYKPFNKGFSYESPITYSIKEIYDKQMVERENFILTTVSEKIGVEVNREELIKALNYDRNQYAKGYADAKAEYAPKWTKVEDGLPKDRETVLIFANTEDDEEDVYEIAERHLMPFRVDKYEWDIFSTLGYKYALDDEDVIAWMPIPKYEEG